MQKLLPLVFPVLFKWTHFVSSFYWYQFLILISLKVSLWFSETNEGDQSSLNLQISSNNKLSWTPSTWIQCSCFYLCCKVSTFLINISFVSPILLIVTIPPTNPDLFFFKLSSSIFVLLIFLSWVISFGKEIFLAPLLLLFSSCELHLLCFVCKYSLLWAALWDPEADTGPVQGRQVEVELLFVVLPGGTIPHGGVREELKCLIPSAAIAPFQLSIFLLCRTLRWAACSFLRLEWTLRNNLK